MHPVLKRILLHGGLTAAVLALIGVLFAELAGLWLTGSATRSSTDADEQVGSSLRSRVPLTMALWGFGFVAVCELVAWRVRGTRPPATKSTEAPSDDAEKLLNELLAQAEAKMALEAESQKAGDREQKTEDSGQRAENKEQSHG
ncbi:hypothetical protein J8F10_34070 [Gemmata sp. G18]|uniref:Uncharacterized protein n=1 Tax=Gemmata palustris TaxID=2822762 RepID=A0ABS5C3M1_9BACT|nr:hypothetical protein [Gemmata palustris]MBP3960282.1 hypothetical protein [Gemmata palustris]